MTAPRHGATLAPPFPLALPTSDRVARALAVVERTDDAAVHELCAAVEACVTELHRHGMTSEAVIATMQAFVRHTAAAHSPPGHALTRWVADAFMVQIVRWCIVAYYRCEIPPDALPDGDPPQGAPPQWVAE